MFRQTAAGIEKKPGGDMIVGLVSELKKI